jgi:hypothetical protein
MALSSSRMSVGACVNFTNRLLGVLPELRSSELLSGALRSLCRNGELAIQLKL